MSVSIDYDELVRQRRRGKEGLRSLIVLWGIGFAVTLAALFATGWMARLFDDGSIFGGVLFFVFGGAVCWPFAELLVRHLTEGADDRRAKQPVSAVVTDARAEPFTTQNGTLYAPQIQYQYEVSGTPYCQTCLVSTTRHNIMWLHARTLSRYAPGTTITVYVDSRHPERSLLKPVSSMAYRIKTAFLYALVFSFSLVAEAGIVVFAVSLLGAIWPD
jgi:hypothetical protein